MDDRVLCGVLHLVTPAHPLKPPDELVVCQRLFNYFTGFFFKSKQTELIQ